MKLVEFTLAAVLAAPAVAMAESDMKGMDMKGMDHQSMSKGGKENAVHSTSAVVKEVDPKAGTVTLAHGPVKTMNWPAMSMTFKVKDKPMLDKLSVDKKVDVEFVQQGKDYVVTSVK